MSSSSFWVPRSAAILARLSSASRRCKADSSFHDRSNASRSSSCRASSSGDTKGAAAGAGASEVDSVVEMVASGEDSTGTGVNADDNAD